MPKIRLKQIGNTSKSGNLNQNFRKVLKDDQHLNNFVLRDNFHTSKESFTDEVQYNDNDTIMFVEKSVNATLGIEKKYFLQDNGLFFADTPLNNKILHTPNSFGQMDDTSFNVNKIPNDVDYKNIVYVNYKNELDNNIYEFYKEDFALSETFSSQNEEDLVQYQSEFDKIIYNFKKQEYQIEKDYSEIEILFNNLDKKALSFNLNNFTPSTYTLGGAIPYVKYPNPGNWHDGTGESCFLAANNNTIYLKNSEDDYSLGSIFNKFSSINSLLEQSCVTHNPLTFYNNDIIPTTKSLGSEGISNPITNCGFPFDAIFRGKEEVSVSLDKFITSDFILEKIYVEFGIQNFSISNNNTVSCFNTLNFFILNQRGDIKSNNQYNSYWNNPNDYKESTYYNTSTNSLDTVDALRQQDNTQSPNQVSITNTIFRSPFRESEVQNSFSPSILPNKTALYNASGDIYNTETVLNNDIKQREVVTSIKIANIGKNIQNNTSFFSSLDGFDKVLYSDKNTTEYSNWDGNSVFDVCIHDDFKTVKILSKVKSYKENKNLKKFSNFEIYPKQRKNRTGIPFTSEKSYSSENQFSTENTTLDERSQTFDLGIEENHIESPYILNPKDKLIFGFNFAPNMKLSSETLSSTNKYSDLTGRDVLVLDLSGLKLRLIGRYVSNKKSINVIDNIFENKNIKKINEYAINVVDKSGLPLPYMLSGTYYDNYGGNFWPRGISTGQKSFAYNVNIPIDPESEIPYGWIPSFGWTNSKFEEESRTEFRQLDDTANKKYQYYRFGVSHFGFQSDKFNENKHYAYINVKTGEITRNIKKIFRKNGFLKEKVLNTDTFNSYNTDRYASLEDDNIWFKEIP